MQPVKSQLQFKILIFLNLNLYLIISMVKCIEQKIKDYTILKGESMRKIAKIFLMVIITFSLVSNLYSAEGYQKTILKYVNQERKAKRLAPLVMNEKLNKIAVIKAIDMAKEEKLSHDSKKFGMTFNLIKKENIKYKSAAENIARWHDTPEFVMERWMKSKGHRDNILSKNYNEIGIGKAVDKDGKNYWVQIFIEKKK